MLPGMSTDDIVISNFEACDSFTCDVGDGVCDRCGWLDEEHEVETTAVVAPVARAA